jgi:hypothetical protein
MGYRQVKSGQWVCPPRHGYRVQCCDCCLIHDVNFRLVKVGTGHVIELQAIRNDRATAAARRAKKGKTQFR